MFIGITKQDSVGDKLPSYNFRPGDTYCGNEDWGNCQRCRLHLTRHRVALLRRGGSGHIKLLFIGEAPGELENKTGIPFVGIAGRILHHLFKMVHFQFEYVITNAVGCRPVDVAFLDADYDEKEDIDLKDYVPDQNYELWNWNREPTKAELTRCRSHIDEILEHYQPHGVVYLGKIAESYKDPKYLVPSSKLTELDAKHYTHTQASSPEYVWRHVPTLALFHPAYIARLEYKLLPMRKQARKLNLFIEHFFQ